ncbi:hypothetical protein DP107_13435 [Haloglomus irregulare]|jgi:hypothetical protein|uniref:Uncharacterized protein n=1 Tax=Haloglomus irregulare TaxID=2234134 RepID=A0A554MXX0_9EURY|nr:hypothetical protein [Haloglomus irregulare]TSD09985.1 hypothetical protein DP107_13435 [Haloglomus irregulare]
MDSREWRDGTASRRRFLGWAGVASTCVTAGCPSQGKLCANRGNIKAFLVDEAPNPAQGQAYEDQPEVVQQYARRAIEQNATEDDPIAEQLSIQETREYTNSVDSPIYVERRGETVRISLGVPC